jgi:hypothetical protein
LVRANPLEGVNTNMLFFFDYLNQDRDGLIGIALQNASTTSIDLILELSTLLLAFQCAFVFCFLPFFDSKDGDRIALFIFKRVSLPFGLAVVLWKSFQHFSFKAHLEINNYQTQNMNKVPRLCFSSFLKEECDAGTSQTGHCCIEKIDRAGLSVIRYFQLYSLPY